MLCSPPGDHPAGDRLSQGSGCGVAESRGVASPGFPGRGRLSHRGGGGERFSAEVAVAKAAQRVGPPKRIPGSADLFLDSNLGQFRLPASGYFEFKNIVRGRLFDPLGNEESKTRIINIKSSK